jgi:hypothetical protein
MELNKLLASICKDICVRQKAHGPASFEDMGKCIILDSEYTVC